MKRIILIYKKNVHPHVQLYVTYGGNYCHRITGNKTLSTHRQLN